MHASRFGIVDDVRDASAKRGKNQAAAFIQPNGNEIDLDSFQRRFPTSLM